MFRELTCHVCGCTLHGGLDTYGEPGQEVCQGCHTALTDEAEFQHMRAARWVQDGRGYSFEPYEYYFIFVGE